MKRSLIAIIFFTFASGCLWAQSAAWVRTTDRSSNPEILALMTAGDFDQALEIAAALGERPDAYLGDIIVHYLNAFQSGRGHQSERVLVTVLTSLFPARLDDAGRAERYRTNREALIGLIRALPEVASPDLKTLCIQLSVVSGEREFAPLLAGEAGRIVEKIKRTSGRLDRDETRETFALFAAFTALRVREAGPLLADLARFSEDRGLVEGARAASRALRDLR